jgi:GTP-binding protein Era
MKSGFVAVVGRPSAGKSTMLNALCGEKVSIVASVPQTTRNSIRGIVNREGYQAVFVDTPGWHLSEKAFNKRLAALAENAVRESDAILYVLDSTRASGPEEESLAAMLAPHAAKLVVAVNKIDDPDSDVASARLFVSGRLPGAKACDVSALKSTGVEQMMLEVFSLLPEGPAWYPEDYYTDQDPAFRISEIIREKLFKRLRDELPHAIFVDYVESRMRPDGALFFRGDIVVERESQKGIVIGAKGAAIQRVREEAEAELAEIFPYPVVLSLKVRVDPDWRRDAGKLDKILF